MAALTLRLVRLVRPVACAICARQLYQAAWTVDVDDHRRYCGTCAGRLKRREAEA